jgi:hypothetical protein
MVFRISLFDGYKSELSFHAERTNPRFEHYSNRDVAPIKCRRWGVPNICERDAEALIDIEMLGSPGWNNVPHRASIIAVTLYPQLGADIELAKSHKCLDFI